ncbi:MAG: alpha-amylase [Chloroflexi bacterium]|nr:alpha-amylase [Chloroflexota bacterium]
MFSMNEDSILRGFHVSGLARDKYQFDLNLFMPIGKAAIPDFLAARTFAAQMNRRRDVAQFPEQAVRASHINAMALIHGITQYVFRSYVRQVAPNLLNEALAALQNTLGTETLDATLDKFVDQFPPLAVYKREQARPDFLNGSSDGISHRQLVLEEILMLYVSNANPAFAPYLELFSDAPLKQTTGYPRLMEQLYKYFEGQRESGGAVTGGENIIDFLLAPVRAAPHSLDGQLAFLMTRWSTFIGAFIYRLLRGMDFIKEEEFKPAFGIGGPGNVPVISFDRALEAEPERYTPDRDWMPRCVLIAKNSFVWLDQLTKKYQRPITRLDQIPDEELDMLARAGITGLWLIGLWERSKASRDIKVMMGNPDAVASAYSLFEYRIAVDLGGDDACDVLRQKAWARGIRLASDMVPNHVGIDGKWVYEHPDWFVSLPQSPFPSYSFSGPDLSADERVGIYLEDHYYSRSDAAVVFKRVDKRSGDVRYIYHGNDGTSMPWNDTAQLNYLNPAVREAMIQTIIDIARRFPIIRFDAAMTLVKRHYHRLWFPEPGGGGDIPSRSEHGMTRAAFDQLMPEEFWREVVDRAAVEAPDTLLLAEAFWLMEGYFVRSLGMHRVYNSAFMNMLRDEKNAEYRSVMKNTLEFDPEVLKRYVNFMNNPDERTAVEQFGKGDKYFAICTLMMTLPGLPMVGHGQIEGFSEKYGMEYRRAYYDESPDQWLIQRHEHDIFPLARKRYLFAGVDDFLLYDFFTVEGTVNEDVYAYSNRYGDERALVVVHNKFNNSRGWIRTSAAFSVKTGQGDERALVQRSLGEGLGLQSAADQFCIFRDLKAGLEYIRSSRELLEQGLYIELGAYQYQVFLDFRVVRDDAAHQYAQLAAYLGGRGVPNMEEALQELFVQPIHTPFKTLLNAPMLEKLLNARVLETEETPDEELLQSIETGMTSVLTTIAEFAGLRAQDGVAEIATQIRGDFALALALLSPENTTLAQRRSALAEDHFLWQTLFSWLFVRSLGRLAGAEDSAARSRSWLDEWLLGRVIGAALQASGMEEFNAGQAVALVKAATMHQSLFAGSADETADSLLTALLQDSDVQRFMRVNRWQDMLWFDKDAFESLLRWLLLVNALDNSTTAAVRRQTVAALQAAADASDYQVEKLRAAAKPEAAKPKPAKSAKADKKAGKS